MNPLDEIAEAIRALQDDVSDLKRTMASIGRQVFTGVGLAFGVLGGMELVIRILVGFMTNGVEGVTEAYIQWLVTGLIPWWLTIGGGIGGLPGAIIIWHGAKHKGWLR